MAKSTLNKNKQGYGYCYTDLAEINKYCEDNGIRYYQEVETSEINQKDYIITYIEKGDKVEKHSIQATIANICLMYIFQFTSHPKVC